MLTITFGREIIQLAICIYFFASGLPTAKCQTKIKTDHHVHIFSPDLLAQIKRHRYGAAQFKKHDYMYSNVDSILKYNNVDRLLDYQMPSLNTPIALKRFMGLIQQNLMLSNS